MVTTTVPKLVHTTVEMNIGGYISLSFIFVSGSSIRIEPQYGSVSTIVDEKTDTLCIAVAFSPMPSNLSLIKGRTINWPVEEPPVKADIVATQKINNRSCGSGRLSI